MSALGGRILIPSVNLVGGKFTGNNVSTGGFNSKKLPIQVVQPPILMRRKLMGVTLPFCATATATGINRLLFSVIVYFDVYLNSQMIYSTEVVAQSLLGEAEPSQKILTGMVSAQFQNPITLPNPANLEIAFHGVGPGSNPVGTGNMLFYVNQLFDSGIAEVFPGGVLQPSQGSFEYIEESIYPDA